MHICIHIVLRVKLTAWRWSTYFSRFKSEPAFWVAVLHHAMKKPPDLSIPPSPVLPCQTPDPLNRPQKPLIYPLFLTSPCAALASLCPCSLDTAITPLRSILRPIFGVPAVICPRSLDTVLSMVLALVIVGLEALLCTTQLGLWSVSSFEPLPLFSALITVRLDFTKRVSLAFLPAMLLSVTVLLDLDVSGMASVCLSGWLCLLASAQCFTPNYHDFMA